MISLAFDMPLQKGALLQKRGRINLFLYYSISDKTNLENNSKQIYVLIGLKPCFYLTITGTEINFFRQAPTGDRNFFSVAKWKNVAAKKCR